MSESRIYGINACQYFYKHRKNLIIRAFFSKKVVPQFGEVMSYLAKSKKVYRTVPTEDLAKISKSEHHEGVCFIVQKPSVKSFETFLSEKKKLTKHVIFALEGVGNPHNLGAIMRVCAHFGVDSILHQDPKLFLSGAAMRVAEGGAEFVEPIQVTDWKKTILSCKKSGYKVLATSSHGGDDLYSAELPEKLLILFGSENSGLTEELTQLSDAKIKIPGTEKIESLNVSTAISVVCSEIWRKNIVTK